MDENQNQINNFQNSNPQDESLVSASEEKPVKKDYFLGICILAAALIVTGAWVYDAAVSKNGDRLVADSDRLTAELTKKVLPASGVVLPVKWNNLGAKLIEAGVIDIKKFEELYQQRGGLDDYSKKLLYDSSNGNLIITQENSGFLLNLLWAFGLGNKNNILEKGPMMDKQYGGDAGRFASTGGWGLAKGNAMDHYSRYSFVVLSPKQQELVERVSKNIYRPCCNNSPYFPDCNHGMAMLGLLELMASQGISEKDMYKTALQVNAYWFPDTYLTIAQYFQKKGIGWDGIDPKEVLGVNFSSSSGYQKVLKEVAPQQNKAGGSCGV